MTTQKNVMQLEKTQTDLFTHNFDTKDSFNTLTTKSMGLNSQRHNSTSKDMHVSRRLFSDKCCSNCEKTLPKVVLLNIHIYSIINLGQCWRKFAIEELEFQSEDNYGWIWIDSLLANLKEQAKIALERCIINYLAMHDIFEFVEMILEYY